MREVTGVRSELMTSTVTQHVEESPATTAHAALLGAGALVAAGPVEDVLTEETLSRCFGVDVAIVRHQGSWSAHARHPRW